MGVNCGPDWEAQCHMFREEALRLRAELDATVRERDAFKDNVVTLKDLARTIQRNAEAYQVAAQQKIAELEAEVARLDADMRQVDIDGTEARRAYQRSVAAAEQRGFERVGAARSVARRLAERHCCLAQRCRGLCADCEEILSWAKPPEQKAPPGKPIIHWRAEDHMEQKEAACEHEDAPTPGTCPGCGMVFVYCHPCSVAGGAERGIYHEGPPCPAGEGYGIRLVDCRHCKGAGCDLCKGLGIEPASNWQRGSHE